MTRPISEMTRAELVDEVVRLQQRNADLAAHVERQRETLQWIWDKVNLGGWAHERVKTALADTPDTSLARLKAQWQAEALQELYNTWKGEGMMRVGALLDKAIELQEEAEGGEV